MKSYTPEEAKQFESPEPEVAPSYEYLTAFNNAVESGDRPVKVRWSLFRATNHEEELKAARNVVIAAGWEYAGKESTGYIDGSFFDVWKADETTAEGAKGVPGEAV